ncbi:cell division protein CrgA [Canibacter zhoujuaniae]|uniref:cell division protein CrgA n=1 Tax=Canibacter zhoujuaniae TaxID=2708343 RepID=UPI0014242A32|nr:cell division protein CrgA [Canibacter zhoujuaniae]
MSEKQLSKREQAAVDRRNARELAERNGDPLPNPVWFKPVMLGLMILGLLWIVVYYITSATLALPVPQLGQWNILVGFGLIMAGFFMTTRWR